MSTSLWQHSAAAPLIAGGLIALTWGRARPGAVAVGGLWFGLATVCRPSNLLIALVATGYVARHHRPQLGRWLAWAAPAALLQGGYGLYAFGDPFATGQLAVAQEIALHKTGSASVWLSEPRAMLSGILGQLLSPSRGLFVFSPVLLFGAAGLVRALREGGDPRSNAPLRRWLLLGAAGVEIVHGLRFDWWGGWSYGYRQMLDIVPLLMVGAAGVWPRIGSPGPKRGLFMGALLFSAWVQFVGARAYDMVSWNDSPNVDLHPERLWSISDSQLLHYLRDPGPRPLPVRYEFPPWTLTACPLEVQGLDLGR